MRSRRTRAVKHDPHISLLKHLPLLLLFALVACVVFYNYARFHRMSHQRPIVTSRWQDSLVMQENRSPRCQNSGICWNTGCGEDGLGCFLEDSQRREKIVEAIQWSWQGYKKHAWGMDTLLPHRQQGREWMHLGLTIVDSLDTLLFAGLHKEFQEARAWVHKHLDVENATAVSVFEANIRVLGGLLSAYFWSDQDSMFLNKAVSLADRLVPAFKTLHGLATPYLDLSWGEPPEHKPQWMKIREGTTTLADAGTFSMEFTTVSLLTGRPAYGKVATHIWTLLDHNNSAGLHCNSMFIHSLTCATTERGVAGCADSAYEYMLKQWLLSGKRDQTALKLYKNAMRALRKQLVDEAETRVGRLTYVGVVDTAKGFMPTMEHLACFLPGLLALGHYHGVNTALRKGDDDDLALAKKLMETCNEMYRQSVTGLAPESAVMGPHTLTSYGRRARPLRTVIQRWDNGKAAQGDTDDAMGLAIEDAIHGAIPNLPELDVVDLLLLHKWWRSSLGLNMTLQHMHDVLQSGGTVEWLSGEHRRSMEQSLAKPLSGEGVFWSSRPDIRLRPETVESLYILYRITKDAKYKHWAWQIFRAFNLHCRAASGGYATLERGDMLPPWRQATASMPSYWLAETLKYLYLMYDDDMSEKLSLDAVVFSTEAHPLPVHTRPWEEQVETGT